MNIPYLRYRDRLTNYLCDKPKDVRDRYTSRLNANKKQMKKALAEIESAFFIEKICGYKIAEWEPPVSTNSELEFSFEVQGETIFCEVKCPGWDGEIFRQKMKPNPQRLKEPKYKGGDVLSLSPLECAREALEKAAKQLSDDKPSIVIINDDLQMSPMEFPGNNNLFYDGSFANIGGSIYLQSELIPRETNRDDLMMLKSQFHRNLSVLSSCELPQGITFADKSIIRI